VPEDAEPAAQLVQLDAPELAEYAPAGQSVQVIAAAIAYFPAMQNLQLVEAEAV